MSCETLISPGSEARRSRTNPSTPTNAARTSPKVNHLLEWDWELLSWLVSFLAFILIVVVALSINDRPLPDWPLDLTPNTLVSALAEVAVTTMTLPVAEGIGQLKWVWFRSGDRKLEDLELYELASRGSLGRFNILLRRRLWNLVSFGALIALLAIGLAPLLQQSLIYSGKEIMVDNALVTRASLYYGLEEIDARTNDPMLENRMRGAIYGGLFGVTKIPSPITTPRCSTGNCTWSQYTSLAVCHSCRGISADLQLNGSHQDGTKESFAWVAPNDFRLEAGYVMKTSTVLPSMKHSTVKNPILILHSAFYATGTYQSDEPPTAHECIMFFCVKSYHGRSLNGVFTEEAIDTWPSPGQDEHVSVKTPQLPPVTPTQWPSNSGQYPEDSWHMIQRSGDSVSYKVDVATLSYLRDTIGWLMSTEIQADNGLPQKNISETGRAIYKAMTGFSTSLPDMIERIAISMTNTVRNKEGLYKTSMDDQAIGEATKLETYVQVRWFWIYVAIGFDLLSLCFSLLTVRLSSRACVPVWKSSILALLTITWSHKSRSDQIIQNTSLYDCERWANGITVRLTDSTNKDLSRNPNDQGATTTKHKGTRAHDSEQLVPNTVHMNEREDSDVGPTSPTNDGRDAEQEYGIVHSSSSTSGLVAEHTALLEISRAATSPSGRGSVCAT